jgi:hypothetical protein
MTEHMTIKKRVVYDEVKTSDNCKILKNAMALES